MLLFMLIFVFLLIQNPGRPEPVNDTNGKTLAGSLSEQSFQTLGRVKRDMFKPSKHIANPVFLNVHGGPAFPDYSLFISFKPKLENFFYGLLLGAAWGGRPLIYA